MMRGLLEIVRFDQTSRGYESDLTTSGSRISWRCSNMLWPLVGRGIVWAI